MWPFKWLGHKRSKGQMLHIPPPPPLSFWWSRGIISIIQLPHHAPRRQLTHWTWLKLGSRFPNIFIVSESNFSIRFKAKRLPKMACREVDSSKWDLVLSKMRVRNSFFCLNPLELNFRTFKIIFWYVPSDIPSHDLHNFPNVRVSIYQTHDGNRGATLPEGAVGTFLWWNWSIVG